MSVLKQDFGEVLQVFSDVLRQPRFDPARLEVARRGIEAGIARQNDDPELDREPRVPRVDVRR